MKKKKTRKFTATVPPVDGGVESVGAVSHEFESFGWDAANAYCDAMGWRLDGEVVGDTVMKPRPEKTRPEKARRSAEDGPGVGNGLLTRAQKAVICQLAKSAFDHMDKFGLIEGVDEDQCASRRLEDWRRMIVMEVTGKDSLTKCRNSDFRRLEAEFLKLGGEKYENPQAFATGRQSRRGKREVMADTMENRETQFHLIVLDLLKHAKWALEEKVEDAVVTQGYILSIARAQNKGTPLPDFDSLMVLEADVLARLLFTTRNRIAAKECRGETRNRNQGQRKRKGGGK